MKHPTAEGRRSTITSPEVTKVLKEEEIQAFPARFGERGARVIRVKLSGFGMTLTLDHAKRLERELHLALQDAKR